MNIEQTKQKGGRSIRGVEKTPFSEEESREYPKRLDGKARIKEPELCAFLDSVLDVTDFDMLYGIFEKYLIRSGVDAGVLNRIPRDHFFFVLNESARYHQAYYNPTWNYVALNVANLQEIKDRVLGRDAEDREYIALQVVKVIIHELVHAASNIDVTWQEKDVDGAQDWETNSCVGYRGHHDAFVALNEGVTERVAQEIFMQYVQAKGLNRRLAGKIIAHETDARDVGRYPVFMAFVEELTRVIDESVGLDPGTTWEALKRGVFEGSPLDAEEVQELFRDTFGEKFLQRYKAIHSDTTARDLGRFGGTYELNALNPNVANRWLEYLGVSARIPDLSEK